MGKSGIGSTFGAAGSVIVVFVWVYYSAQVFLLGAEFTWVYDKTFGSMKGKIKDDAPVAPTAVSAGPAAPAPTTNPTTTSNRTAAPPTVSKQAPRPRGVAVWVSSPLGKAAMALAAQFVAARLTRMWLRRQARHASRRKMASTGGAVR